MSGTLKKIDKIIENKKKLTFRQYNRLLRDLTYLNIPYSKWFDISKKTDYIKNNLVERKKERLKAKKNKVIKHREKQEEKPQKRKIVVVL